MSKELNDQHIEAILTAAFAEIGIGLRLGMVSKLVGDAIKYLKLSGVPVRLI